MSLLMCFRNAACDPVRKLSSLSEAVESQKEADLVEIKGRLQLETSKRQQMEEEVWLLLMFSSVRFLCIFFFSFDYCLMKLIPYITSMLLF